MNRLVAVVGLPGAGKSEVVNEFVAAGWQKVYFGGITLEEVKKAGLPINEANERIVREKLRQEYGMNAYAKLSIPKIEKGLRIGSVVIDGLYSWEEYVLLQQEFPKMEVLAIWSPPSIRYGRLANRPVRPLTQKEAENRDRAQIENLHQAGPIAMATATILNTKSLLDLREEVKGIINAQKS